MKTIIFCLLCVVFGSTALFAQENRNISISKPALPVKETYIPDDIVAKLSREYPDLYSISCIKGKDGNNEYWIRTKNGMKMAESRLSESDVYAMK